MPGERFRRHESRWLLIAIWIGFAIRALFYCSALPLWEGFDEYAHYAVIQNLALGGGLPNVLSSNCSREVAESLRLAPWPWLTHASASGSLSYEDYWRLSQEQRERRRRELDSIPRAWSAQPADPAIYAWEAQQPPLYYWLAALIYRASESAPLPTRVWILRSITALIAALAIPLVFLAAREFFLDESAALAAAVAAAAFPELVMTAARTSNEGLAIAFGSLTIFAMLRSIRDGNSMRGALLVGLALGLSLLTKAYFLAFLPALPVVFGKRWRPMLAALAACAAIAAWWYVRTAALTGTLTGEQLQVAAHATSTVPLIFAVRHSDWIRVFDFMAISHIWLGGWSFLVVRTWMYRVVEALLAVAIARAILRRKSTEPWPLIAALLLSMLAGLLYHAATGSRTQGAAGTMGYYFYCLIAAEAILVAGGLGRLLPAAVAALATIEIFGAWFLQFPYYAGFIQHTAGGALPAFRPGHLSYALFERLATIFPHPAAIATLAVVSVAAALTNIGFAIILARWRPTSGAVPRAAMPPG